MLSLSGISLLYGYDWYHLVLISGSIELRSAVWAFALRGEEVETWAWAICSVYWSSHHLKAGLDGLSGAHAGADSRYLKKCARWRLQQGAK